MNVAVEVYAGGQRHDVMLHDLSRTGMFLRFAPMLPVGTIVHIAMEPVPGTRVVTAGTVVHAVDAATARATGRFHGIGIELRDPIRPGDREFATAIEALLERRAAVVRRPTTEHDLERAPAVPLGTPARRVILRGNLDGIDLPSLLAMLENERKTCQLVLARDEVTAAIELVEGRIADARSTETDDADPREVLMMLLDWTHGDFELSTGGEPRQPASDLAMSVTHLVLEHARVRDEQRANA